MNYNPHIHHRRSIRLKGYDYSRAGLYFITICAHDRVCRFGEIVNGEMDLNDAGRIAQQCWCEIPNHFPNAVLHEYIVMLNHVHGIIELTENNTIVGAKHFSPDVDVDHWANNDNGDVENNDCRQNDDSHFGANDDSHNRAKNISPLRSPSKTIGSVVRGYKIGVTKWVHIHNEIETVWQRNHHEHIIRDEQSYQRISEYIVNNPAKWNDDTFNPLQTTKN